MVFLLNGFFVICLLTVASTVFKNIGADVLFNPDALLIVIGGTVAALFIGFPVKRINAAVNDIISAFREKSSRETVAKEIIGIARMHRKLAMKKLEQKSLQTEDSFLRLGINLLLNHFYKDEEMRTIMEREMAIRITNFNLSHNVIMTMARLAPAFGLAGTVIGLIKIFKHFQSFEIVIPLMATALMSTLYGVVISNLILLPLSAKIKERAILCEELMHITVEGIIAVNNGDNPLIIEEKLLGCSSYTHSTIDRIDNKIGDRPGDALGRIGALGPAKS